MARLAPPAAAKMSNADSTVAPLTATLKVRWPAAVQNVSAKYSVTVAAAPAAKPGMVYVNSPYRSVCSTACGGTGPVICDVSIALVVENVLVLPEENVSGTKLSAAEPPALMETVAPAPVELKIAVTDRAAVMARVHVAVPPHEPVQPANVEPLAGVAVSVMVVPVA